MAKYAVINDDGQRVDPDETPDEVSPLLQEKREVLRKQYYSRYVPEMKRMGAISDQDKRELLNSIGLAPMEDIEGWKNFFEKNWEDTATNAILL